MNPFEFKKNPKAGRRPSLLTHTPTEMWQQLGLGKPCMVCGQVGKVRIKVFYPVKEYGDKYPHLFLAMLESARQKEEKLPMVELFINEAKTRTAAYLKLVDVVVCKEHEQEANKQALKAPSYCYVTHDYGPDPKNKIQQKPTEAGNGVLSEVTPTWTPKILLK